MPCEPYVESTLNHVRLWTTASRPTGASRAEGSVGYNLTTDTYEYWDGSAWIIWSEPFQTQATFTVTQSATVNGTVDRGWSRRQRGEFEALFKWTSSGAGTAANAIAVSLPYTLANLEDVRGTFHVIDVSPTPDVNYAGALMPLSTTTVNLACDAGAGLLGVAPAFTLASGDIIRVHIFGRYA